MALFSSSQNYLGIDFDAHSIKLVELTNDRGRPRLVTYGYYDHDLNTAGPVKDDPQATAQIIKYLCKKAKVTTNKVVSALPTYSVFSSVITLPALTKKELPSAIEWQAKKVIPMPIDEMILDWKVLEEHEVDVKEKSPAPAEAPAQTAEAPDSEAKDAGLVTTLKARTTRTINKTGKERYMRVLLTAAPKDLVKKYIDTIRAAGLNLLSLDTESFALVRSLVGNDRAALMIVDLGAVVTTVSIVVNGVPVLNRSIDVGGYSITTAIANSLNVNLKRAEQFKYDIGMNRQDAGQGSVPETISLALQPIVDEVRYTLNLYKGQGQKKVEKIILTGGSSLLLNLPEYLSNQLDLKAYRGNAWARVVYPEDLGAILDELGPRFSIAVGLAMRDIVK